jgi:hypothetical protein
VLPAANGLPAVGARRGRGRGGGTRCGQAAIPLAPHRSHLRDDRVRSGYVFLFDRTPARVERCATRSCYFPILKAQAPAPPISRATRRP